MPRWAASWAAQIAARFAEREPSTPTTTREAVCKSVTVAASGSVIHGSVLTLAAPAGLEPLFRHGVQVDRMSETVTDTLRCLYLEAWGYKTRVEEFVGTEHTAKNLLIVASRTRKPGPSQDLVERALEFQDRFGIQNQRLQTLLMT